MRYDNAIFLQDAIWNAPSACAAEQPCVQAIENWPTPQELAVTLGIALAAGFAV